MRTPLCDLLGIEFPIFAFSHCRDVIAAVTKAGGFGVLGAAGFSPDQLEVELDWIDDHVGDRPYGVDIIVPAKYTGVEQGGMSRRAVDELIPDEHREFVDQLLEVRRRAAARRRRTSRRRDLRRGDDDVMGMSHESGRAPARHGLGPPEGAPRRQRPRPGARLPRHRGPRAWRARRPGSSARSSTPSASMPPAST